MSAVAIDIYFDWVTIPAGEFLMGSDKSKDKAASDTELPQHRLYLPQYQIMRVPVTVAQFAQFINATNYKTTAEKEGKVYIYTGYQWEWVEGVDWAHPVGLQNNGRTMAVSAKLQNADHPVACISWDDAVAFCQWAKVRLPTEAEWEKAARGTDGRIYPWGNNPPDKTLCNFGMNEGCTTLVGQYLKGASPYDVLDMAGNVIEWTSTRWCSDYHGYIRKVDNELTDPTYHMMRSMRILRGGSWIFVDYMTRSACRLCENPGSWRPDYSFRCVRTQ